MVLISTYWNVNAESATTSKGFEDVLISTYWNVNAFLRATEIFAILF